MHLRFVVILAALLLAPGAAFATDVGPQDGNTYGGGPYRLQCYANGNNQSYLYGMSGMIGAWVDRVGGECADWVPGQGWSTAWNARSHTGTTGNSPNGGPQSAICPAGTLVKGFRYTYAVPDRTYMQNITLFCVDPLPPFADHPEAPELKSDDPTALASGNAAFSIGLSGPQDWPTVVCPGNEVAIGLQGTSGDFVDQVGLICGAPPTAPASSAMSPSSSPSVEGHWNEAMRHRIASMGTTPGGPGDTLVEGTWQTDLGTMHFVQNQSTVTGTYPGGSVTGTLNNGVLDGSWRQAKASQECPRKPGEGKFYGLLSFTFSNGNRHFDGRWTYCDTSITAGYWKGDRIQ